MRKIWLMLLMIGLVGCLNLKQARVTPEHRQLKNKVGIVVFLEPAPRLRHLQLSALESTASTLKLPDWNVQAVVTEFLTQRMHGMGLEVKPATYASDTFPSPYDSSMAYPNLERMRPALGSWAEAQGLDMVVAVYRQAEQDFIGDSIENLIGYGLVRHSQVRTDAYAMIYLEALDTEGRLIGNSDGQKALAVEDKFWRADFDVDKAGVEISGPVAKALTANISQALLDAVLTAAQEAGLSH
jgi:hypothetical protein